MFAVSVVLVPLCALAQPLTGHRVRGAQDDYGRPQPYEFSYVSQDQEGTHGHSQQSDAQGQVQGHYTIQLADGRARTVHYTADENGYRAEIQTNEIGTESKSPADVRLVSSAITGEQAAHQAPAQGHHLA